MALYREWVNFVLDPLRPGSITSLEDRLDTSVAGDARSPSYAQGSRAIIYERDILSPPGGCVGDELMAMEVTAHGVVTVWTRERVWFIAHEAGRIEKLRFVPRHPPAAAALSGGREV